MKFKTLKGQDQQETSSTPICCCCPVAPLCSTLYSRNLLRLMSIESVMPSNLLILCHLLLLLPFIFPRTPLPTQLIIASLLAQMVKNQPAIWETWVGKMPCRKAWKPTPVFLPGESPWTKEAGGLQSMGSQSGTRLSY